MQENQDQLPDSVTEIETEGKKIYLVGTAHVSHQSVRDVRTVIQRIQPDSVCVELCPSRYKAIVQHENWRQMDIFKIVKEQKALFLLVQLIMSSFYKKIGKKLGITPGAEMVEGIQQAEKVGAELILADRDVNITLKRVWGYLSIWQRLKLLFQLVWNSFGTDDLDEKTIEALKGKDQLEVIMEEMSKAFPEIKKRLIDERDLYLADRIQNAPGKKVVAIVGAGHVNGICTNIHTEIDVRPLLTLPPRSILPVVLKWAIPIVIVLLLIFGFFKGGARHSIESISIWILINGFFSALGVTLALAHPLTIIAAFVAAPLTSLNPTIAAGWVSGLVQAWVKKPKVADLENLPKALGSLRLFWLNPVCRILLVVVLANLGSSLGTFIAGSWIAARSF
ncbi:MAG: TraB/GumN family protein [Desulfohalobiaceae bacterium]|nr:TraB/GumN family protein [Desulfohalobiaceae bacterium]MCF8106292.1 TraB/GumN family protein [Desulfohalobiaceae bacterium]